MEIKRVSNGEANAAYSLMMKKLQKITDLLGDTLDDFSSGEYSSAAGIYTIASIYRAVMHEAELLVAKNILPASLMGEINRTLKELDSILEPLEKVRHDHFT